MSSVSASATVRKTMIQAVLFFLNDSRSLAGMFSRKYCCIYVDVPIEARCVVMCNNTSVAK